MMRGRGVVHRFSSAIGRPVEESQRNSIATFNDLSVQTLQEARTVLQRGGRFAACEYLRFLVDNQSAGDAEAFCEDVLEGQAEAATWRVADCLLGVSERSHEGIEISVAEYISFLEGAPGALWFRSRRIASTKGEIPMPSVGPGALLSNMRYWTPFSVPNPDAPLRLLAIEPCSRVAERIQEADIDVEIRRWMTTVAAWWARHYLATHGEGATIEGVIAAYPNRVAPSTDGLTAIEALVKEARSGDSRWPEQAGLIGPDAWYR